MNENHENLPPKEQNVTPPEAKTPTSAAPAAGGSRPPLPTVNGGAVLLGWIATVLGRDIQDENEYRRRDLLFKFLGLVISILGFITVIVTIRLNTEQLRLNVAQSERVAKSLRVHVGDSVVSHVTELDKIFMNEPGLLPYFYGDREIAMDHQDYPKVYATAVMVLDVFDLVVTQNRHFPEYWDTPEAWDEWIIDVFSHSPILRDILLCKHPKWYGDRLTEMCRKGEERWKQRPK